jgi:hypothetical protein
MKDAAAASAAMQNYLPQDQKSRLTVSMARLNGETGIGVGYAYMLNDDNNAAVTLSVGAAGSETAVRGSFGFEFGGSRSIDMSAYSEPAFEPSGVTLSAQEYDSLMLAQASQASQEDVDRLQDIIMMQSAELDELRELTEREAQEHVEKEEELKKLQRQVDEAISESERRRAAVREKLKEKSDEK